MTKPQVTLGLVFGLSLLTGSCASVSFQFEPAPPPPSTKNPVEACIAANSMVVASASGKWTESQNITTSHSPQVTILWRIERSGLTFYVGDKRLTAQEAVNLLKDPRLTRAYTKNLQRHKRKASTANAWAWGLSVPGWIMTAVGFVVLIGLTTDDSDKVDKAGIATSITLLTVGSAVASGGIIAAMRSARARRAYRVRRTIFVDTVLARPLKRALRAYNKRIIELCRKHYSPTALPLPPPTQTLPPPLSQPGQR